MSPVIGVVLGSGLGAFAETLEDAVVTRYDEIPGWPRSTAMGHAGKLACGRVGETAVMVLAGRAHLYEGYTAAQVTFGIRELARRGVRSVVLTNAAGGINLNYRPGDLVLISDHINLLGANPLTGPNDDALGPRFPDMSEAYSRDYREMAKAAARELGFEMTEGVYAAVPGPSYETPAEIRYLRTIGADLVGMSTVPETIAANHLGMKVLAISCVTNMAAGILPQKLSHVEVMETGERVQDRLIGLLRAVVGRIARGDDHRTPPSRAGLPSD
ncbi:MAG TPA: purine-nucleoside phosphorylase [Bryobacteraceae bacterium]|nr:purine-nucleoside phosphorylase [Bryobacteraceae bacterium]